MQADAGEMKNLAADPQHASLVAQLRQRVQEYAANTP